MSHHETVLTELHAALIDHASGVGVGIGATLPDGYGIADVRALWDDRDLLDTELGIIGAVVVDVREDGLLLIGREPVREVRHTAEVDPDPAGPDDLVDPALVVTLGLDGDMVPLWSPDALPAYRDGAAAVREHGEVLDLLRSQLLDLLADAEADA
ncbi:hypothetical protein [Brachybacterium hainanense]|uniref:Uncharacterized protein n=1 Tax=Brachybacterium hainanense TaxID=1541174 RepID=A0ABV6RAL1_9MICO